MTEAKPLCFDHRGRSVRVERRETGWAVLLDGVHIDSLPPYELDEADEGSAELEGMAKQAVNQYLEGKTSSF